VTEDARSLGSWVRWGRTEIHPSEAGTRLDRYLAGRFTYRSRTGWVRKIREGRIVVNEKRVRPSYRLRPGDVIRYKASPLPEPPVDANCPVLYEDEHLLAVNKSGNIPVHPSGRYFRHCLLHILAPRYGGWDALRIVHRLDRETSGVLVFARSPEMARRLAEQFQSREVRKSYLAVVWGDLDRERLVDLPLGRNPASRVRKAVGVVPGGRPSQTRLRPLFRAGEVTLVEAIPLTGRLHQIRVHLREIGHPILGDKLYGRDEGLFLKFIRGEALTPGEQRLLGFRRQALHAWRLRLRHPATGQPLEITAPLPEDLRELLASRGIPWNGDTERTP
jgi:RluA family pseudouridine synthase